MEEPEMQIDMFSDELVLERKRKKENIAAAKKQYKENKRAENPMLYWATNRIARTKSKCKKEQVLFTITVDWLLENAKTHCPLLGIELTYGEVNWVNSASIDRKNPKHGYTPENCFIISNKANRMKGDATLAELTLLVENLKNHI